MELGRVRHDWSDLAAAAAALTFKVQINFSRLLKLNSGNARRRNPCTDKGLICRASGRYAEHAPAHSTDVRHLLCAKQSVCVQGHVVTPPSAPVLMKFLE